MRHDSHYGRRPINTSTDERTSVPATIEPEIEAGHTLTSVNENKNDKPTMTKRTKSVTQKPKQKTKKYENRQLTATLNLNKNHRML